MAKLPVKFYTDTMPGMPQITNQYGEMVGVLDCVLVNGTTPTVVLSATFANGLITITCASPQGFEIHQVVELMGADQFDYNGEFRIVEIVSSTIVRVATTAVPAATEATGVLKIRIPPLGYEIAFTGTNKRAYRSGNLTGTRPYLRVDNSLDPAWNPTYGIVSRVTAARTMSDVDTFTSGRMPFDPTNPTQNETVTGSGQTAINGWYTWAQSFHSTNTQNNLSLSISSSTSNRRWMIVGDDKAFYFVIFAGIRGSASKTVYAFGEFDSFAPNDLWNYFLIAQEDRMPANQSKYFSNNFPIVAGRTGTVGMAIARNFSGYGYSEKVNAISNLFSTQTTARSGITACIPYPNGADFSMWFCPRYIVEAQRGDVRGMFPGTYFIPHNIGMADNTIIENVLVEGHVSDKKMIISDVAEGSTPSCLVAFDIIGPWRTT